MDTDGSTVTPGAGGPHLLRLADLGPDELRMMLDLAERMKQDPVGWRHTRAGGSIACIFEKPSTRTRLSTAAAAQRLGMFPHTFSDRELQLSRGESMADTGRVMSEYVDLIVLRTREQHRLADLAAAASVPVINALSDDHHPCQALADLLTLRECFGELKGLKLAYVGDAHSNICHSLLEAAAITGVHLAIASPPGYGPDPAVEATARRLADQHGGRIELVEDPADAVRDADAVYPEIWVSMGAEPQREKRIHDLSRYRVDRDLMVRAKPQAIFLHCLPAYRGEEVTSEVLDGPQSHAWRQAGNRLPTAQAVIYTLTAGQWSVAT